MSSTFDQRWIEEARRILAEAKAADTGELPSEEWEARSLLNGQSLAENVLFRMRRAAFGCDRYGSALTQPDTN